MIGSERTGLVNRLPLTRSVSAEGSARSNSHDDLLISGAEV